MTTNHNRANGSEKDADKELAQQLSAYRHEFEVGKTVMLVVRMLVGMRYSDAKLILDAASDFVFRCAVIDPKAQALDAEQEKSHEIAQFSARAIRRHDYYAKAKRLGMQDRLKALAGCQATALSLEQLEAEFGGDFLQQERDVDRLNHPDDSAAGAALHK